MVDSGNFNSGGDMNAGAKIWRDKHGVCHIEGKDKVRKLSLITVILFLIPELLRFYK